MQSCLVFGAGASLANALHFHNRRYIGENPPLDYTFFECVEALKVRIPSELRGYASAMPGSDPFQRANGQPAVSLEEFFKELFSDFQEAQPKSKAALAYEQLLDVYVHVLRRTTDWMGKDNRRGAPIGQLLDRAAGCSSTVKVLTFNHDLVLENEILKRKRLSKRWCVEQGYGSVSGRMNYSKPSAGLVFPPHTSTCDHARGIEILKLHGSLNWYLVMQGRHPSAAILRGSGRHPKLHCTSRRSIEAQFVNRSVNKAGKEIARYTWPVIIPPVHSKEGLIRQFIPEVWADADQSLRTAERIVFIGYSLPRLDVSAERLFRRAIAANGWLGRVDVINPDTAAAHRFASVCSPSPLRWYQSIESFLQEDGFA